MKPEDNIETTSIEFDAMAPAWQLLSDTNDGAEAIRQAGEVYIPQHPREPDDAYSERVENVTVFPFVKQTVDELSGRVFARDPIFKIDDEQSPWLTEFLPDIDRHKRQAANVLRRWFSDGLLFGVSHLIIDVREGEERPFWQIFDPRDVFFIAVDSVGDLNEIRYRREVIERDGFAEISIQEVVRWTNERIEIYRSERNQWVLFDARDNNFGRIPLISFFTERRGPILTNPPLVDLAELMLSHTRKQSDLDTILRVASFPMLAIESADGGYENREMVIGPHQLINLDPDGDAKYVEHTGASINVLRDNLKDIEERAASYGAKFLKRRPSVETATARIIDNSETLAPLQGWVLAFQEAVNEALAITQELWGRDDRPEFKITTDFLAPEGDPQTIIRLRELGDLSRIDALTELKRRGVFSGEFDLDRNEDRLASEGPLVTTPNDAA